MNYTEVEIGGESYKLRLNTRACASLEKALGYNPIQMLMDIDNDKLPKVGDLAICLRAMLEQYQHGYNIDKVYDLIDAFCNDGHNLFDLIPLFLQVFTDAGFIGSAEENDEKNA